MHTVIPAVNRERESCWTRNYLLRHCLGYQVQFPFGPVGVVEEVVLDPDEGEPLALRVRHRADRPCHLVPIEDVLELLPRAERILVGRGRLDESRPVR